MTWWKDNFDKLLLTMLVFLFMGYQLHLLHDKSDGDAVHWAREQTNYFSGALVGLITGAKIAAMRQDKD